MRRVPTAMRPILLGLSLFLFASLPHPARAGVLFQRGDVTRDGALALDDAFGILGHLFQGGPVPGCLDAADADDSGAVDLADAVHILRHLFLGGAAPPPPHGECGVDRTDDFLGCVEYSPCALAFDGTRLHAIDIEVSAEDLAILEEPPIFEWPPVEDPRLECRFVFDGVEIRQAGIRRKGNASLYNARKGKYSFSVKFNEFVRGRRLFGLEKLLLQNCALDPTFLNEAIGYGIYRRMGLPAPLTSHAAVTLNGRSLGLYLVKEAVDEDFLERVWGEEASGGNLYEGPGDILPREPGMPIEWIEMPRLLDEDQGRTREGFLAMQEALLAATPEDFLGVLEARIDLEGFVTGWAIDSVSTHFDGYPSNFYLFDDPRGGRFIFLPHGMDQLFGWREYPPEDPTAKPPSIIYLPTEDPLVLSKGGAIAYRLSLLAEGDARYRAAVRRVTREGWDLPSIEGQIDRLANLLSGITGAQGLLAEDLALFVRIAGPLRAYARARKAYLLALLP